MIDDDELDDDLEDDDLEELDDEDDDLEDDGEDDLEGDDLDDDLEEDGDDDLEDEDVEDADDDEDLVGQTRPKGSVGTSLDLDFCWMRLKVTTNHGWQMVMTRFGKSSGALGFALPIGNFWCRRHF